MEMRILSAVDVTTALPMEQAVEAMKAAYSQLSAQTAHVPLRSRVSVNEQDVTLFMPAFLPKDGDFAVKVVSVFPSNAERDLPTIHAAVLVIDSITGRPLALLEGGTLTAIRTGAGAGAATDILAPQHAPVAAILGSGVQSRTQLEAICTVRDIEEVRVYSPNRAHAEAFATAMAGHGPIPARMRVVDSPRAAVTDAHIICAATTSSLPVFDGKDVKPGAHINGVGSFLPTMQEIDTVTVQRALVVVDSRPAALAEAGDLIIPLRNGDIQERHIHAELGEIINGARPGRSSAEQITFFKSVGVAVQDAAAASVALRNAGLHNLGTTVSL